MAYPAAPTKTNSDAGADDPKPAILVDLAGVIDWAGLLLAALGAVGELDLGEGVEDDGAGNLRVKLQATSYLVRTAAGLALDVSSATGNALLGTRWRDFPRVQKTADYTVQVTDAGFIIVMNSASPRTINLPALATADVDGMVVGVKNQGAGALTVDGSGTQTVGGQLTRVLNQGQLLILKADETAGDWDIIGGGSGAFASGTRMLFQQTSAPVGWTKQTGAALNNSALRIVTGTVGGGGADVFDTVFGASKTTQGHTLTIGEMAPHAHGMDVAEGGGAGGALLHGAGDISPATRQSNAAGGGGAHTHPLTLDLKYNDCIVAVQD